MVGEIPVILENGPDKAQGLLLRITATGLQVELDKIIFKVGTLFNAHIQLEPDVLIIEKARSIKHYDNFFRTPPPKKLAPGVEAPISKKLCELHFSNLSEVSKMHILKFLLRQQENLRNRSKDRQKS